MFRVITFVTVALLAVILGFLLAFAVAFGI